MIKLTLKQLNDSYPALKLAAESITAGKMKYRFARVLNSADAEIELLGKHLAELAVRHGAELVGGNRFDFEGKPVEAMKAFNREADEWLRSEVVELWGDPQFFTFDEIEQATSKEKPISAATLANLLFLISDTEPEDKPKAASASA